jgi:hypothetical protein
VTTMPSGTAGTRDQELINEIMGRNASEGKETPAKDQITGQEKGAIMAGMYHGATEIRAAHVSRFIKRQTRETRPCPGRR